MRLLPTLNLLTALALACRADVVEPASWKTLVKQDPKAKSLLVYCHTIKDSQAGCAERFLGLGRDDVGVSGVVARKAAFICLERQRDMLARIDAFKDIFQVDLDALARTAQGNPPAARKGYHFGWSKGVRDQAKWKAFAATIKEREAAWQKKAELEKLPGWVLAIQPEVDAKVDKNMRLAETMMQLIMGAAAGHKAYNDPASVGIPPDQVIPDEMPEDSMPPEEAPSMPELPEVPPSEIPPPDAPPPDFDDESEVDLTPELISTPVLQDETVRTSMQACQESVEREIFDAIGSTTADPNAQTGEEASDTAEHLRSMGICDVDFYGRAACAAWKDQLVRVPLAPEDQAAMESYLSQHTVCPVNLITPTDCNKAKQAVYMRFVVEDETTTPINLLFKPGPAVPWLPRLDLEGLGGGGVPLLFDPKKEAPVLFAPGAAFPPPKDLFFPGNLVRGPKIPGVVKPGEFPHSGPLEPDAPVVALPLPVPHHPVHKAPVRSMSQSGERQAQTRHVEQPRPAHGRAGKAHPRLKARDQHHVLASHRHGTPNRSTRIEDGGAL